MNTTTINRGVGDKQKGLRLQKLRAIDLLLDAVDETEYAEFLSTFAVIEFEEDIHVEKNIKGKTIEYFEEDKDYDPNKTFTYVSPEILNTLVSFLDCWNRRNRSKDVFFGFYTNIGIGKEKETERIKKLGLTLTDDPILKLLKDEKYEETNLLSCVKSLVLEEYKSQYSNENIKEVGFYDLIKEYSDEDWKEFFKKISWNFGEEDEEKLKIKLIEKIKRSRYYDSRLNEKENHIIALLEQKFDERQKYKEITRKSVHASELKCIYMEVKSGDYKLIDPAYKMWETLDEVTDKRNLKEKIISVCNEFNQKLIGNYSRKVAYSRILESDTVDNKEFYAFKWQVYDTCKDELDAFLNKNQHGEFTQDELEALINQLKDKVRCRINSKSNEFKYMYKSDETIYNCILELIDSCYLAFDD